ncbi:RHS repeat-associated core domain-containing protein, partial [Haploplasma modicum]|uniref:RHS repeat-associated core domain-containing protein n=1 Tax=Haploplasma modicum TaxID=2150 RepID=UPI00047C1231
MVIGFNYLDKEYFYERDLLGNIISIIDAYDVTVLKYEYTAFGIPTIIVPENLDGNYQALANKLKNLNIYLYKGYIYDVENKLYYCESRYYDPELGRWLSIDSYNYLDPSSANG